MALAASARHALMSSTGSVFVFLVFDRQADTCICCLASDLQEVDRPQIALAEHGEGLGVLDVFQVHAIDPAAEGIGRVDRVFRERRKWPVSMQQPILGWWSLIAFAIVSILA